MTRFNNFDEQVMKEQEQYYNETLNERISFEDLSEEEKEELKKDVKRTDGYYGHKNRLFYIANDFFTTVAVVKKVEKM